MVLPRFAVLLPSTAVHGQPLVRDRVCDLVQHGVPDLLLASVQGMGAADPDHVVSEMTGAKAFPGLAERERQPVSPCSSINRLAIPATPFSLSAPFLALSLPAL